MRTRMSLGEYRRSKARVKTAIREIEGIKKVAVTLAKEGCDRKLDDLQYRIRV
jgi:copper chaperone CopZ